MAVFFKKHCAYSWCINPHGTLLQATYLYLLFSGIARNAEMPATGRSQRYCSNSYRSIPAHTYSIWYFWFSKCTPYPNYCENNTDIYLEATKATVTVNHKRRGYKFLESRLTKHPSWLFSSSCSWQHRSSPLRMPGSDGNAAAAAAELCMLL
jgi:hypothetical protein